MRIVKNPVLCNYYLTYRCNATCSFCDIWERPSPYAGLENIQANFADLKRLGVKIIDLTGGEPLLHRQIAEICELAKSFGFVTTLTTNTLLYPKYAEKLQKNVDMLHFSLDSAFAQEHDLSRGVKCFDSLLKSIEIAKKLGEKPDILFTVSDQNIDQIEDVWKNIALPNHLVLILNPIFDYHAIDNRMGLSDKSLEKLAFWAKKKNIFMNEGFIALRKDGGNHIEKPICKAASSTIVISPKNELILPCYHLEIESFPIDNQLFNLYRSPKIQHLISQEGKYSACEGCAINCYMQPSFAVEMNKYFWKSLPSTIKYNLMKGTWKKLFF
ncbi:MAG: radical SAM protein [Bacteroidetes bacterium]|nr:MAG: radical SAM protein [Bacteroidota bacterium]